MNNKGNNMNLKSLKDNIWVKRAGLVFLGMVIVIVIGTPDPAERIVTVEKPVEKVVTVDKTVEKTPISCITALDISGEGYTQISNSLTTGNYGSFVSWVENNSPKLSTASNDCRSKQ